MRSFLTLLITCALLLSAFSVSAQEAAPDADRAEAAADAAERYMNDASRYAEQAMNFLGIFEAVSVVIAIVAGGLGAIGVTRLFSAQRELSRARERVDEELAAVRQRFEAEMARKEHDLQALSDRLQQTIEQQRRTTEQATLALALLPLGERQYRAQDLKGAADTYLRALTLDDDNPLIHYRLGYVYVQSGQLAEAEFHLNRALEIDREFWLAMAALGYVYRRIGDKLPPGIDRDLTLNKAETYLLDALRQSPKLVDDDSESWWGSLGGLYRRRGQIDQAIYAYQQAAQVTPHSSYPSSNLALLYMQKRNREDMLRTYKRVERLARGEVQAEVDNYWAYADLLTSRLALGKVDEAEDALISVFDIAPSDSPYALESLVETLERLLDALGGAQAAPHIPPFIQRIRARIKSVHPETVG